MTLRWFRCSLMKWLTIVFCFVLFNIVLFMKLWHRNKMHTLEWTIVYREFYPFHNSLNSSIIALRRVHPELPIVIITDKPLYPPLKLETQFNIHCVSLETHLRNNFSANDPLKSIDTQYLVFFSDLIHASSSSHIDMAMDRVRENPFSLHGFPASEDQHSRICLNLAVDIRQWTVEYSYQEKKSSNALQCNAVNGPHVLISAKSLLYNFPSPLSPPFPESLYMQAAAHNIPVLLHEDIRFPASVSIADDHVRWKKEAYNREKQQLFYSRHGIKKIVDPDKTVHWFGCTKETVRCFTTVYNDTPEYLLSQRWTPPCCLENLRHVIRHVIQLLEKHRVRYWLEGGSLLGAARNGDVIPWDYDADIGLYEDDVSMVTYLDQIQRGGSIIDDQGFLWERAIEGSFYRVHFSQINRMHVDIFPFRSRNGMMIRGNWNTNHKQDRDFPEYFLRPTVLIPFVGILSKVPNNYRDFLEFKFGAGVIEHPFYH